MSMKNFLDMIREDIRDVKNTSFEYATTQNVPSRDDQGLTFESGVAKKGKIIKTCVLYVDIRNSVSLYDDHRTNTMGKIYTAFSKSMLKIAQQHNGFVRNIIGDRVMIVFPTNNCFTNAVDCAISINHTSGIMRGVFTNVDFKCGIGIDYGEMKVIKVGIQKQGSENIENKNLVWVGKPANIASRLTDVANKEIERVKVKYNDYISSFFTSISEKIEIVSHEEFSKNLTLLGGKFKYKNEDIIHFKKEKIYFPPILMTEAVFNGYKRENPNGNDIKENFWKEQPNHNIKNVSKKVYGGGVIWRIQ
ncbi:adenylate/guanylate cyclase domain-containing protein [Capnocytophaga stomatis]